MANAVEEAKFILHVAPELENQTLGVVHDGDHGRTYDVRYDKEHQGIKKRIVTIRFYNAGRRLKLKGEKQPIIIHRWISLILTLGVYQFNQEFQEKENLPYL